MWLIFAVLSAVFAALTAILAKIGIEGINSNSTRIFQKYLPADGDKIGVGAIRAGRFGSTGDF